MPAPKVDSAVLRLNILKEPPVKVDDEKKFFKVVKAAFSQRRKTLSNSLASGLSLPKAEVNAILDNSSVPLNARAEQLKLEDFANIANNLGDEKKNERSLQNRFYINACCRSAFHCRNNCCICS